MVFEQEETQGPAGGVKRQKRSKFGRQELRSVTRTSKRSTQIKTKETNSSYEDDDSHRGSGSDSGEEVDDYDDEDDEGKKATIASKRNNRSENKMAYSALVTLLKSEHDDTEDMEDLANFEKESEEEDLEGDDSDSDKDSEGEEEEDEPLDVESREQDDIDVLNKYDSFNLHFNEENHIEKVISKFESLPEREKRLKLISKKTLELSGGEGGDDEKYIKYRYGYPQVGEELADECRSGSTLEKKLKYHNVKRKVAEKFGEFEKEVADLDMNLIESMLTYETLNFQYMNNEILKSKYQDYYILHIMNHLMKTRDRILNNNEKKNHYETKLKEGVTGEDDVEPEFRDQGYTRPKVLILLPSRNFAYKLVMKLISNLQMENVENKKKFKTQFYDDSKISDRVYHSRPKDFEEYFDGNSNDMFVLGIKYTRKTLKLYSPLEQSDIIIASPIGLLKLYDRINSRNSDKTDKKKGRTNEKGNDGMKNNFLSSIEICIIDKAEGIMMQNWNNITDILNKHLNQTPKDFMNVDFSRIRMWAINGQSNYVTQIMCFNKYATPEMVSIVKRSKNLLSGSTNYVPIEAMSVIDSTNYKMYQLGLINKVERLKQVFMRFDFDMNSIVSEPEKRFEMFKNVILPQIVNKSSYKYGTLVYIPSYFDYLRIKKYLNDESSVSFVAVDEYSSNSKLTRSRALFQNKSNQATLMLYTERLHFYKRFDIKGVRNVIFYQLPSDPDFYQQVLEFVCNEKLRVEQEKNKLKLQREHDGSGDSDDEDVDDVDVDLNLCMVRAIYSKLDAMRFAPIVGSENVSKLANGESEITEFS